MKATMVCLAAVAGLLTSAPVREPRSLSARPLPEPAVTCEPGTPGCAAPQQRVDEPPVLSPENHPCDWVETCQLPCGREGGDCCHAEWECPPDANMPRC